MALEIAYNMDKHYISDSLLFDIWCWRELTPALMKRALQQLANNGINYTTIEADCWYGERTPALNYELQYTPFNPTADGFKWDLDAPNAEWDTRLREFVGMCNQYGIAVQLQLFTQQYNHWRDFTPWQGNLWPCQDVHREYVHRAVTACLGLDARYSAGCELSGNPDEVARFHVDVLEITFVRGVPLQNLLLGTDQEDSFVIPKNDSLESQQIKAKFDQLWMPVYGAYGTDSTAWFIRRYAHGVHRLNLSGGLDIATFYHGKAGNQWEFSTDGDWTGDSTIDFIEHQGRIDRKPSAQQMYDLSAKLFDAFNRPIVIDSFHEGQYDGATGRPVMERLIDITPWIANTLGCVIAYEERYGKLERHGEVVVDPMPEPPQPPQPPTPPVVKCTLWYHLKRLNFRAAFAHLMGKHNG